jgi:hypothetical protein
MISGQIFELDRMILIFVAQCYLTLNANLTFTLLNRFRKIQGISEISMFNVISDD